MKHIDLIFDGPPGPEAPRLLEAVDSTGRSVEAGKWIERPDGKWVLRISGEVMPPPSQEEMNEWADGIVYGKHPDGRDVYFDPESRSWKPTPYP